MSVFNWTNFDLAVTEQIFSAEKLAATAATIAIHNFEWRYITLLFFNSTFLYGLNNFLMSYNKSVITSTGLEELQNAEEIRQYVIFGIDIKHMVHSLDWMQSFNFDNTGRFIIICESEDCNESEAVETFWYHKITNVVFLKNGNDGKVKGYIYFFSEENCAMGVPVEIDMLSCLQNITACILFPKKLKNLYECPLIVSTFQHPPYMMDLDSGKPVGIDGTLLCILTTALNATLKIMTPVRGDGWGSKDDNGTWLGSLGDIYYDIANMSMTSAALTLNRFSSFHMSYNYNSVIIGWISSPTELESASLKLLHPFSRYTHIAVASSFMLVLICGLFVRSRLWKRVKRRIGILSNQKNEVVFYSWMICMGLALPQLPKKSALLYAVFIWIWYTFLVRTMYQASLINSLKTNVYTTNVETVEDMLKNNYKFGGGFALKDYFIDYPEAYDNFVGMNFSEIMRHSQKISGGEKFGLAANLEAITSLYFTHGEPYHQLEERIIVSPSVIYFKKFSPLAESVNTNLRRLVEGGITDRLYRIFILEQMATSLSKRSTDENQEPMTLDHFTGCYVIIFAGWLVSSLIFICEIFFANQRYTF